MRWQARSAGPVCVILVAAFSERIITIYDRFGEELVNEFIDVINQIDASSRSELREINELNWARFDAKLEQRLAELRGEILTAMERGFKEHTRWMFLAWSSLLIPIIGLWMRR